MMMLLVVFGGLMVAAGLFGLGYCVWVGFAIRREKPSPEEVQKRLRRLIAINFGSVGLGALGLGLIVVGLTLGS